MRSKAPIGKSFYVFFACAALAVAAASCRSSDSRRPASENRQPAPQARRGSPAADTPSSATTKKASAPKPAVPSKRPTITAKDNPTTAAGRGDPDLEDQNRPSAWIYIDGHAGRFKEEGGHPLLQWFVEEPVCDTPSFRVEAFTPVIGDAKDFKAVLRTVESVDGTDIVYGIAAYDGTFELGREYPLLNPGENFIIRNGQTGDVVREIAPLPPGTYAIAAGVKNAATGKQTLAVTYFAVAAEK